MLYIKLYIKHYKWYRGGGTSAIILLRPIHVVLHKLLHHPFGIGIGGGCGVVEDALRSGN
jgi:hypothetical protein